MQGEEHNAEEECQRLGRELDDLFMERQSVITWARKGVITADDLETQLMVLKLQESELRAQLAEKQVLVGNRVERLMELANLFHEQVLVGVEAINAEPETPEQAERQLDFRRRIVRAMVRRVDIDKDGGVHVQAELELPSAIEQVTYPSTG